MAVRRGPTVAERKGASLALDASTEAAARPDLSEQMIREATKVCEALENEALEKGDLPAAELTTDTVTLAVGQAVGFCAQTALKLALAKVKGLRTGDDREVRDYEEELKEKFGLCDVQGWAQCATE